MKRAARFLFGFRPDLSLTERWWHRLFKVAFSVGILLLGLVFAWLFSTSQYNPEPVLANVQATTLQDFLQASSKDVVNVVPEFLRLSGQLGQIKGGRIEGLNSGDLEHVVCTPDGYRHAAELAELWNNTPSNESLATAESITRDFKEAGIVDSACMFPPGQGLPQSEAIVKYSFTTKATATGWAKGSAAALVAMLGIWLAAANWYYRGLVYIICGPRKESASRPTDLP